VDGNNVQYAKETSGSQTCSIIPFNHAEQTL